MSTLAGARLTLSNWSLSGSSQAEPTLKVMVRFAVREAELSANRSFSFRRRDGWIEETLTQVGRTRSRRPVEGATADALTALVLEDQVLSALLKTLGQVAS